MKTSPIDPTRPIASAEQDVNVPFQAPVHILEAERGQFKSLPRKALTQVLGVPSPAMLKRARAVGIGKLKEAARISRYS